MLSLRNKAILVARGYNQEEGLRKHLLMLIDYEQLDYC